MSQAGLAWYRARHQASCGIAENRWAKVSGNRTFLAKPGGRALLDFAECAVE